MTQHCFSPLFHLGIDVGSTTVKVVVWDPERRDLLYRRYERHNARQVETLCALLRDLEGAVGPARYRVAICGSGGQKVASTLDAFFIQEVVANAIAIREYHAAARVAIELGGQDAKVIFFERDPATGRLHAADLRMNGSCAGGTGAFLDQMAELLGSSPQAFGQLAEQGQTVYPISGRCGVFAKTDIQPLLNQGVAPADIALSCFHAVAKQTIGGLAQGAPIRPPVVFEGGPLTFNPRLVAVFAERLGLAPEEILVPAHPEVIVALGAALAADPAYSGREETFGVAGMLELLARGPAEDTAPAPAIRFFADAAEQAAFRARHASAAQAPLAVRSGERLEAFIGIDAGSTTSKVVVLDRAGQIRDLFYSNNLGDPLVVIRKALLDLEEKVRIAGGDLVVKGLGATGYGEMLVAKALRADFHAVETVAHAEAALHVNPGVSFILDIGGQDMKAITLKGGIVTGIVLNEACSAGCGSFLETYARSLEIPVEQVADTAFSATAPSRLGSRCTVFMNSRIVTEQREGKTPADIMAGLCRSVIENVFTKVVRVPNFDQLGETVMVQGGTFRNDAVLRALEQFVGRPVVRAPHPGEMGALGIALLTKKAIAAREESEPGFESTFIGFEALAAFSSRKKPAATCSFCTNHCQRTVVEFTNGEVFVTGNRCERGEVLGDPRSAAGRIQEINARLDAVPDLFKVRNRLLTRAHPAPSQRPRRGVRIGIPRVLEFWQSLPFWQAFFTHLGYEVVLSATSSYPLFESGLPEVPSDTVCFPAKLAHGHVRNLLARRVDRIFLPVMHVSQATGAVAGARNVCAVVQGYPMVLKQNDDPESSSGVSVDTPSFHWYSRALRDRQILDFFKPSYGLGREEVGEAIAAGDRALAEFNRQLRQAGAAVLAKLEELPPDASDFAVVLAGRPYHHDELVNHGIPQLFTNLGVPVLTLDSLPDLEEVDLSGVRVDLVNPFHAQLFAGAKVVASHPRLQLVQIVSFGCGHDAVNTDEVIRILERMADKQPLVLKVDEGEAIGPLTIRIKSFIETVRRRSGRPSGPPKDAHRPGAFRGTRPLGQAFAVRFEKSDRHLRTIFAPNLSPAFTVMASAVVEPHGYRLACLPMADLRAKELGKRFVHNDICYPAQINIGEFLAALENKTAQAENAALALAKNCDDCRAGQYAALARKALDDAGYPEIPIVTTGVDRSGMHPGFKLGLWWQTGMLYGIALTDALEEMVLRIRPYELDRGQTDRVYGEEVRRLAVALRRGHGRALAALEAAVLRFNEIPVDRSVRRPRALVVGEILCNFHSTANENILRYLERHHVEVVLPHLIDFFRRDLVRVKDGVRRHLLPNPAAQWALAGASDWLYERVLGQIEERMRRFRFFEERRSVHELADLSADFIDKTFTVGEGWAIPAEILHHAEKGVEMFIIVQPFGCMPNHITGRGMTRVLKRRFPTIKIVSLDFDADTSFANIENRLQMLIMSARQGGRETAGAGRS